MGKLTITRGYIGECCTKNLQPTREDSEIPQFPTPHGISGKNPTMRYAGYSCLFIEIPVIPTTSHIIYSSLSIQTLLEKVQITT